MASQLRQLISVLGGELIGGKKKRAPKRKPILKKRGRTTLFNKSRLSNKMVSGTAHKAPIKVPKHHYRVEEHTPTKSDIENAILKLKRKQIDKMIPIIDLTKDIKPKREPKREPEYEYELKKPERAKREPRFSMPESKFKPEPRYLSMPDLESIPEGEGSGRYISGLTLERQLKNYVVKPR